MVVHSFNLSTRKAETGEFEASQGYIAYILK